VFVEVGTGSLKNFVADTLAGRPHLAIESNREDRTGLAQLQHLSAALWVEGARFDTCLLRPQDSAPVAAARAPSTMRLALGVPLVRLSPPLERRHLPAALSGVAGFALPAANDHDPLAGLLRATLDDIDRAGREVLAVWQAHRQGAAPAALPANFRLRVQRRLDIESTIPLVKDHELYPQRAGWPVVSDRRPVVPLTMEALLVRDAFEAAQPGLKVIELRQIQAYKWLDVSDPVTIEIGLDAAGDGLIDAEIAGYFRARLVVAPAYPAPPRPPVPELIDPRPTEADPRSLYDDRWMFHGPAYRGVAAFAGIGENGIDGVLRVPEGQGALLDNMGQLAGYWVMEQPENCLAMPIGVERLCFFAPDPAPGALLHAQVRVTRLDALNCVSDLFLRDAAGDLCVRMEGWHTRRYVMDRAFSTSTRDPARHAAARELADNVMVFEDIYDTAMVRDYISRTYLTHSERAAYDSVPPRRRRQWLAGRVAAKDAVLTWLRRRDAGPVFPQEVLIRNDAAGLPEVVAHISGAVPAGLRVSISHKDRFAAAIVGMAPVGIDIERIEPRAPGFLDLAFTSAERALFGEPDDVAAARFWVAKEVIAKRNGTGLQGRPKDFVIDARDGDSLRTNGVWVRTQKLENYILGWTNASREQPFSGGLNLQDVVNG
jgi:phosphopantetheinyl transferase